MFHACATVHVFNKKQNSLVRTPFNCAQHPFRMHPCGESHPGALGGLILHSFQTLRVYTMPSVRVKEEQCEVALPCFTFRGARVPINISCHQQFYLQHCHQYCFHSMWLPAFTTSISWLSRLSKTQMAHSSSAQRNYHKPQCLLNELLGNRPPAPLWPL